MKRVNVSDATQQCVHCILACVLFLHPLRHLRNKVGYSVALHTLHSLCPLHYCFVLCVEYIALIAFAVLRSLSLALLHCVQYVVFVALCALCPLHVVLTTLQNSLFLTFP